MENGKMELRIACGAEAPVGADVAGLAVVAQRRAAVVGGAAIVAAAQQTERTSRGSCGVGHAC